jgi:two-component system, OmpR family, phosphate regulon sensor histidine kinase PhoR
MKKSTIIITAIITGVCFVMLFFLQLSYLKEVIELRSEQFRESVNRSITRVSHNMEFEETRRGLINDAKRFVDSDDGISEHDTATIPLHQAAPMAAHLKNDTARLPMLESMPQLPSERLPVELLHQPPFVKSDITKEMKDVIKKRYVYQLKTLNDVVYILLNESSTKPIAQRIDFRDLDRNLKFELANNGITLPYHFRLLDRKGKEIFRCTDYSPEGEEYAVARILFPNDAPDNMTIIKLHFPEMNRYIFQSIRFMVPALIFTVVLLLMYIFIVWLMLRQRKYTEMKNDFINNMTHEFKTPISTISLAAQMLSDPAVCKNEKVFRHISGIINDETKRLRFQVEKVLQVSLYEHNKARYNKRELNINKLVEDVAHTYIIKVKNVGGVLNTDLKAEECTVYGDEIHLTNVVFNLLDNAMKYRRDDTPLQLNISTENDGSRIVIKVKDNGIGIKREDLHKIFERFYRVHTGNHHDVKGFGLGLAYVKQIVSLHDGNIHAESQFGHGTTFVITLPIIKNQ